MEAELCVLAGADPERIEHWRSEGILAQSQRLIYRVPGEAKPT
jgi:hypothetical protein